MTRKQVLIAAVIAGVIVLGLGAWYVLKPSQSDAPATAAGGTGYEVAASDHTLGNPKARMVLIEYAAPICPHCARFNANVFGKLKQSYIDSGKIYYVFRVFPLHPADGAAEKIAGCLPRGKYFSFIDLLFRNQPKWDPEYGVQDIHGGLIEMAKQAGLSAEKADQCISSTARDDAINKTATDAQMRYNINSTPSFVLDGTPLEGPGHEWTFADMAKVLDAKLAAKS